MIPKSFLEDRVFTIHEEETNRTYKMSKDNIRGYINDVEALKQAIYKMLSTEKYEYPIYSFSYGIDIQSLIGKDKEYASVELKRRIKECLSRDLRIEGVENFYITVEEDMLMCTFQVISIYGEFTMEKEVNI